jgi:hypothetical protein
MPGVKIIIRVLGGIGNQLFIYSFAKTLELKYFKNIFIETRSGFIRDKYKRKYQLNNFSVRISKCSLYHTFYFGLHHRFPFFTSLFYKNSMYYNENENNINKLLAYIDYKTVYVDGLWQKNTITDYDEVMKTLFFVNEQEFKLKYNSVYSKMQTHRSIAIHVRRVNFNEYKAADFYLGKVQNFINPQKNNDKYIFYIFSDDKQWVNQNLSHKIENSFLIDDISMTDIEELWLMSKCSDHILGESTFGQWAKLFSKYS